MLDIYQTLQIKDILDEIASYSHSEIAKEKIRSLRMLAKKEDVKKDLQILDEMLSFSLRQGSLPLVVSFDISKYLDFIFKGGSLSPLELDHIATDIKNSADIFAYFAKAERHSYPNLVALSDKLIDLSPLENRIHKVISPSLSIYDNASPELNRIRHQILSLENEIRSMSSSLLTKYRDYLSEASITIRNDHFVLPIKSSEKNKINGVIHDVSGTGQTTFIEPTQLVDLSNELYLAHLREKEEIARILLELSLECLKKGSEIISNNKLVAEFDFIDAKATYGNKHNCFVASISDEPLINLEGARHPLIDEKVVVPNDFLLNKEQRLIIISGPNAGGKTVALKTLGLMVMMSQMGLAIPTKKPAELSFFPRIFADIGDNQSLSDNLSTFAAHVSNLSTITHFVSDKDLVLLDELGTGTSPNEGEAIAIAVADFLLEKKCLGIISSHFEEMKEYAYKRENAVNAMMVFDDKNLLPTYILKIGFPGRSYGLEMAKRYHLKDSVISDAKKHLNKSKKQSINDVLDKLNKVLHQNEEINADLKKRQKVLESKEKDVAFKDKSLQKKKDTLLEDVEIQKKKMIEDAEERINDILRILSDPNRKQKDLLEARQKLREMAEEDESEEEKSNEVINVNDYVEVANLGLTGKVVSIKGNKAELISIDGMSIKTTLDKLSKSDRQFTPKVIRSSEDNILKLKSDVKLELNIIGYHIDEGIDALDKYLDDARIKHFSQVRIIHGMGSGALARAVHEHLKKCDFVKEFHYGGQFDGGMGATIVIFK